MRFFHWLPELLADYGFINLFDFILGRGGYARRGQAQGGVAAQDPNQGDIDKALEAIKNDDKRNRAVTRLLSIKPSQRQHMRASYTTLLLTSIFLLDDDDAFQKYVPKSYREQVEDGYQELNRSLSSFVDNLTPETKATLKKYDDWAVRRKNRRKEFDAKIEKRSDVLDFILIILMMTALYIITKPFFK